MHWWGLLKSAELILSMCVTLALVNNTITKTDAKIVVPSHMMEFSFPHSATGSGLLFLRAQKSPA
eukprot:3288584-Amphidinium_carterae.1